MKSFGQTIREYRKSKGLTLLDVSTKLGVSQALLSKLERGLRNPSKEMLTQLSAFYKVPLGNLEIASLSDQLLYKAGENSNALKALEMAEQKVAYRTFAKTDKKKIIHKIQHCLTTHSKITKAWIYGSFARGDDRPGSDIDIAVATLAGFSYFDLIEVRFQLENILHRNVDLGFADTFKPSVFINVEPDMQLIYEKKPGAGTKKQA